MMINSKDPYFQAVHSLVKKQEETRYINGEQVFILYKVYWENKVSICTQSTIGIEKNLVPAKILSLGKGVGGKPERCGRAWPHLKNSKDVGQLEYRNIKRRTAGEGPRQAVQP